MDEEPPIDFDLPDDPVPQAVILLMGLDESGKTSLTASLCYGEMLESGPSDLVDETPYTHNGVNLLIRELGGRFRFRSRWYENLENGRALVWVVDSVDRGRIFESKDDFYGVLGRPELVGAPVLFVLNKQDCGRKLETAAILDWFEIGKIHDREILPVEASKQSCPDLVDGMTWLVNQLGLQPVVGPSVTELE
jgi:GTPase SAR1 family protein